MKSHIENSCLVLSPEGRIDAANAQEFERCAMEELERQPDMEPVLDLAEVSYISSSGLRAVLKLSKRLPHPMQVRNVSPEICDIFRMTGFNRFFVAHAQNCHITARTHAVI